MGFELSDINTKIFDYLKQGTMGVGPIKVLSPDDQFVPKEGWLWDYKQSIASDKLGLAKTALQIVSFHNSYGGYILYGIGEKVKDKDFSPVELDLTQVDPAQIRNKIKHYTGINIDFTFKDVDYSINGTSYKFGLIHVPLRTQNETPIQFIKNGPEKNSGKPLFNRDDTYYRNQDECIPATTCSDWQILFSSRDFTQMLSAGRAIEGDEAATITHNLPDKNLICSEFVGRSAVLNLLWSWLADEFEYTKILSGDGGKGKTSIAYEFCRSFLQAPPVQYERVVWLSAKEQQFSGITNDFYDLQNSDFNSATSFLQCLAEECALDNSEYNELSYTAIKRDLKSGLKIFPSLYIVDDLDSLDDENQRKVVDACRQLGTPSVRFLVTTRKKLAYSADICIDVPGLDEDDFHKYIDTVVLRYKLKTITNKDVKKIYNQCDGSPLLSASILRLYKLGSPLIEALNEWKGHAGEDARNAALKKEIASLSSESRRILLIIFYFKSCSLAEIKQTAGIEKIKLNDCLEELQSLFLVNEPKFIESEDRFSISNTTHLLVAENVSDMAYDYQKLKNDIKTMKSGVPDQKKGNRRLIGMAISQSLALIKENRIPDAIKTVDQQLIRFPKNSDLLLMKARCLSSNESPKYEDIKRLLKESIESGQKKELAYELLYKSERKLNSASGMLEVSTRAYQLNNSNEEVWLLRLANAYVAMSEVRDASSVIKDLMHASDALTMSMERSNKFTRDIRIKELNLLHDLIWKKLEVDATYSWLSSFDIVMELIVRGDSRTSLYLNARRCLDEARTESTMSKGKLDAYMICVEKFIRHIKSRPIPDQKSRPFNDLTSGL